MIALPYLTKPRFREPCNGCGLCCALVICEFAMEHIPALADRTGDCADDGPCPALEYEGGRAYCGLMRTPFKYLEIKPGNNSMPAEPELATMLRIAMGSGQGCGMSDY